MSSSQPPDPSKADWYADPGGRHQFRYWDGRTWTDAVADDGVTSADPLPGGDTGPGGFAGVEVGGAAHQPDAIRRQVREQAGVTSPGGEVDGGGANAGGTLFDQPVLVVNQKAKLFELAAEYGVYDADGRQLGAVRQVGQTTAKKLLRLVSSLDQFMTHHYEIVDAGGEVQLTVTRPRKVLKSTVVVARPDGGEVGRIVQRNVIGKIHFGLESGDRELGSINAENWRAWNFNIRDADGTEVARITKTFEGVAKAMFTTADNYVLQVHAPLDEPLRSLVVASALSIDTALKQDSGGGLS